MKTRFEKATDGLLIAACTLLAVEVVFLICVAIWERM